MDIEKRRAKGIKDAAVFRKHHPEANKNYRIRQRKLAVVGKQSIAFFNWLYTKEAPTNTDAALAEATIRVKFLEICGESIKSASLLTHTSESEKQ